MCGDSLCVFYDACTACRFENPYKTMRPITHLASHHTNTAPILPDQRITTKLPRLHAPHPWAFAQLFAIIVGFIECGEGSIFALRPDHTDLAPQVCLISGTDLLTDC